MIKSLETESKAHSHLEQLKIEHQEKLNKQSEKINELMDINEN